VGKIFGDFSGSREPVRVFTLKLMGISFSVYEFWSYKKFYRTNYVRKSRDGCKYNVYLTRGNHFWNTEYLYDMVRWYRSMLRRADYLPSMWTVLERTACHNWQTELREQNPLRRNNTGSTTEWSVSSSYIGLQRSTYTLLIKKYVYFSFKDMELFHCVEIWAFTLKIKNL
jgi:hypothetical protein